MTYKPTPKQRKVLEAAQKAGVDRTIKAVCEEAGVSRQTFYTWLKNKPDFALAWDEVWRKAITRHFPSIVAALIPKARGGDVSAARLIADMKGIAKKHEVNQTGQTEIVIRYADTSIRGSEAESTPGTAADKE